ncbi:MAG: malonic semialdehyde reductase [Pseudomonadota bacterium]|nr:malonic semialdehyde reductase [Pseudomonadota bacterium]MDE3038203.1 malonic semialdehyde reductase [Pseudomonadota bacterium]
MNMPTADDKSLDVIFRNARTHVAWQAGPVEDALLARVYDLAKWGPTSANCCPMRIVFVKSREAKEKLKPCLASGNVDKTMAAPVTAIIAHDLEFYKKMDGLWPHGGGKMFEGNAPLIQSTAFRNGSLGGAYFMLAARSLGLDCGPMSGFDNAKVDAAFFAGTSITSNFLCNLGYGDASKLYPRGPRLEFAEACRID